MSAPVSFGLSVGPFTLRPSKNLENEPEAEAKAGLPQLQDAAGSDQPPLCRCHGVPAFWHKDARRGTGGYWQCRVKRREADLRYLVTDKGRATERRRILAAATRRRAARIEEFEQLIEFEESRSDPDPLFLPSLRLKELMASIREHKAA
jgi:hypothetical protein